MSSPIWKPNDTILAQGSSAKVIATDLSDGRNWVRVQYQRQEYEGYQADFEAKGWKKSELTLVHLAVGVVVVFGTVTGIAVMFAPKNPSIVQSTSEGERTEANTTPVPQTASTSEPQSETEASSNASNTKVNLRTTAGQPTTTATSNSNSEPDTEPLALSQTQTSNCDSSYPDVCIAPAPPDLNCEDIDYQNFQVVQPDPHEFDGDRDGIGCEDRAAIAPTDRPLEFEKYLTVSGGELGCDRMTDSQGLQSICAVIAPH